MSPAAIAGRALLVHAGALGDFILALPIVALLRSMGARGVTILGRPHVAVLATIDGQADRILDFETGGFHKLFDDDARLAFRSADALAGHELAINMVAPDHPVFSRRLAAAIAGRVIDLDPRPREGGTSHITEQWMDDLARAGLPAKPTMPRIALQSPAPTSGLILHPGSGGRRKCWPLDCFISLAAELLRRRQTPSFFIGPVERESWSTADLDRLESTAPLLERDSITAAAALLASADHVVANDSGIAHLAAAVGAPVTAIFGPTDPRRWRPLGENVAVVAAQPWPDLPTVLATIEQPPPRR